MDILFNSPFCDAPSHGGGRRYEQLKELLERTGLSVELFSVPQKFSEADKLSGFAELAFADYVRRIDGSWRYYAGAYKACRRALRSAAPKLLVVEALTIQAMALIAASRAEGIKWVACPPNLDSFYSFPDYMRSFAPRMHTLNAETDWLATAAATFAISAEEAYILNNQGAPAYWLDYYPAKPMEARLKALRAKRASQGFYLLLGSAINPPTREGLEKLIKFLKQNLTGDERAIVIGAGTEVLKPLADERISVEGTVSAERFEELLGHAKLGWLYQPRGMGALTRIAELLLAGVPVLADLHAARSAYHYADVSVYQSFDDALTFARDAVPLVATQPAHPVTREEFFVQTIQALCR